ncbi:MAG: FAD-dependent oxidoreductase, partial [Luteitalea sp.]
MTSLSRRGFLSAALIGLAPKSGRTIAGGFVNESQGLGHRLRDGGPFATPPRTRRAAVVIVGGGVAGLSAAWRLARRGVDDFVVLEMESAAGGNARWGENAVSAYPWAAHYVPVPGRAAGLVKELFTDLGVFDGVQWDERHLVHAPRERLFIHGRWQEGLEPA